MADSMVKRVALAILEAASDTAAYDDVAFRDTAQILARAAIKAMREPTEAMVRYGQDFPAADVTADDWRHMIDAALAEPK